MEDDDCCCIALIVALSEILAFIRLTVDLDFSPPVEQALIFRKKYKLSEPIFAYICKRNVTF